MVKKLKSFHIVKLYPLLLYLLLFFFLVSFSFKDIPTRVKGNDKDFFGDFFQITRAILLKSEYDKNTKEFHEFLSSTFERFEFKNLYDSKYFALQKDGKKGVKYKGELKKDKYYIELTQSNFQTLWLENKGNFYSEFYISKNEVSSIPNGSYSSSNSYSSSINAKMNLGSLSHQKILLLLDSLIRTFDYSNISKLEIRNSYFFKNLKSTEDRKILDDFESSYPKISEFLYRYFDLVSILENSNKQNSNKGISKIELQGRINLIMVRKEYPYLAAYLEDISSLGKVQLSFVNSKKHKFLDLILDSKKLELKLSLYTKEGKIIPYNHKSELLFSEAFSLDSLKEYKFFVHCNLLVNIYGLFIEAPKIVIESNFKDDSLNASIQFYLKSSKRIQVSGGFAYLVPSWLIDIFIPGDMEELINHFVMVLIHANHKAGSNLKLSIQKQIFWFGNLNLDTEFLDNFFVRFALKVWNHRILPDEETREDFRKFIIYGLNRFEKDVLSL